MLCELMNKSCAFSDRAGAGSGERDFLLYLCIFINNEFVAKFKKIIYINYLVTSFFKS